MADKTKPPGSRDPLVASVPQRPAVPYLVDLASDQIIDLTLAPEELEARAQNAALDQWIADFIKADEQRSAENKEKRKLYVRLFGEDGKRVPMNANDIAETQEQIARQQEDIALMKEALQKFGPQTAEKSTATGPVGIIRLDERRFVVDFDTIALDREARAHLATYLNKIGIKEAAKIQFITPEEVKKLGFADQAKLWEGIAKVVSDTDAKAKERGKIPTGEASNFQAKQLEKIIAASEEAMAENPEVKKFITGKTEKMVAVVKAHAAQLKAWGETSDRPYEIIGRRMALIQAISDAQCKALGVPPTIIKYREMQGSGGGYAHGCVYLNEAILRSNDPFQIIRTITHENTHHFQEWLADKSATFPEGSVEQALGRVYKANTEAYFRSNPGDPLIERMEADTARSEGRIPDDKALAKIDHYDTKMRTYFAQPLESISTGAFYSGFMAENAMPAGAKGALPRKSTWLVVPPAADTGLVDFFGLDSRTAPTKAPPPSATKSPSFDADGKLRFPNFEPATRAPRPPLTPQQKAEQGAALNKYMREMGTENAISTPRGLQPEDRPKLRQLMADIKLLAEKAGMPPPTIRLTDAITHIPVEAGYNQIHVKADLLREASPEVLRLLAAKSLMHIKNDDIFYEYRPGEGYSREAHIDAFEKAVALTGDAAAFDAYKEQSRIHHAKIMETQYAPYLFSPEAVLKDGDFKSGDKLRALMAEVRTMARDIGIAPPKIVMLTEAFRPIADTPMMAAQDTIYISRDAVERTSLKQLIDIAGHELGHVAFGDEYLGGHRWEAEFRCDKFAVLLTRDAQASIDYYVERAQSVVDAAQRAKSRATPLSAVQPLMQDALTHPSDYKRLERLQQYDRELKAGTFPKLQPLTPPLQAPQPAATAGEVPKLGILIDRTNRVAIIDHPPGTPIPAAMQEAANRIVTYLLDIEKKTGILLDKSISLREPGSAMGLDANMLAAESTGKLTFRLELGRAHLENPAETPLDVAGIFEDIAYLRHRHIKQTFSYAQETATGLDTIRKMHQMLSAPPEIAARHLANITAAYKANQMDIRSLGDDLKALSEYHKDYLAAIPEDHPLRTATPQQLQAMIEQAQQHFLKDGTIGDSPLKAYGQLPEMPKKIRRIHKRLADAVTPPEYDPISAEVEKAKPLVERVKAALEAVGETTKGARQLNASITTAMQQASEAFIAKASQLKPKLYSLDLSALGDPSKTPAAPGGPPENWIEEYVREDKETKETAKKKQRLYTRLFGEDGKSSPQTPEDIALMKAALQKYGPKTVESTTAEGPKGIIRLDEKRFVIDFDLFALDREARAHLATYLNKIGITETAKIEFITPDQIKTLGLEDLVKLWEGIGKANRKISDFKATQLEKIILSCEQALAANPEVQKFMQDKAEKMAAVIKAHEAQLKAWADTTGSPEEIIARRMKLVQAISDAQCKALGIHPSIISYNDSPYEKGSYQVDHVTIREKALRSHDPRDIIATITHENGHHYQDYLAEKTKDYAPAPRSSIEHIMGRLYNGNQAACISVDYEKLEVLKKRIKEQGGKIDRKTAALQEYHDTKAKLYLAQPLESVKTGGSVYLGDVAYATTPKGSEGELARSSTLKIVPQTPGAPESAPKAPPESAPEIRPFWEGGIPVDKPVMVPGDKGASAKPPATSGKPPRAILGNEGIQLESRDATTKIITPLGGLTPAVFDQFRGPNDAASLVRRIQEIVRTPEGQQPPRNTLTAKQSVPAAPPPPPPLIIIDDKALFEPQTKHPGPPKSPPAPGTPPGKPMAFGYGGKVYLSDGTTIPGMDGGRTTGEKPPAPIVTPPEPDGRKPAQPKPGIADWNDKLRPVLPETSKDTNTKLPEHVNPPERKPEIIAEPNDKSAPRPDTTKGKSTAPKFINEAPTGHTAKQAAPGVLLGGSLKDYIFNFGKMSASQRIEGGVGIGGGLAGLATPRLQSAAEKLLTAGKDATRLANLARLADGAFTVSAPVMFIGGIRKMAHAGDRTSDIVATHDIIHGATAVVVGVEATANGTARMMGKKIGGKLMTRALPGVGQALLTYDVAIYGWRGLLNVADAVGLIKLKEGESTDPWENYERSQAKKKDHAAWVKKTYTAGRNDDIYLVFEDIPRLRDYKLLSDALTVSKDIAHGRVETKVDAILAKPRDTFNPHISFGGKLVDEKYVNTTMQEQFQLRALEHGKRYDDAKKAHEESTLGWYEQGMLDTEKNGLTMRAGCAELQDYIRRYDAYQKRAKENPEEHAFRHRFYDVGEFAQGKFRDHIMSNEFTYRVADKADPRLLEDIARINRFREAQAEDLSKWMSEEVARQKAEDKRRYPTNPHPMTDEIAWREAKKRIQFDYKSRVGAIHSHMQVEMATARMQIELRQIAKKLTVKEEQLPDPVAESERRKKIIETHFAENIKRIETLGLHLSEGETDPAKSQAGKTLYITNWDKLAFALQCCRDDHGQPLNLDSGLGIINKTELAAPVAINPTAYGYVDDTKTGADRFTHTLSPKTPQAEAWVDIAYTPPGAKEAVTRRLIYRTEGDTTVVTAFYDPAKPETEGTLPEWLKGYSLPAIESSGLPVGVGPRELIRHIVKAGEDAHFRPDLPTENLPLIKAMKEQAESSVGSSFVAKHVPGVTGYSVKSGETLKIMHAVVKDTDQGDFILIGKFDRETNNYIFDSIQYTDSKNQTHTIPYVYPNGKGVPLTGGPAPEFHIQLIELVPSIRNTIKHHKSLAPERERAEKETQDKALAEAIALARKAGTYRPIEDMELRKKVGKALRDERLPMYAPHIADMIKKNPKAVTIGKVTDPNASGNLGDIRIAFTARTGMYGTPGGVQGEEAKLRIQDPAKYFEQARASMNADKTTEMGFLQVMWSDIDGYHNDNQTIRQHITTSAIYNIDTKEYAQDFVLTFDPKNAADVARIKKILPPEALKQLDALLAPSSPEKTPEKTAGQGDQKTAALKAALDAAKANEEASLGMAALSTNENDLTAAQMALLLAATPEGLAARAQVDAQLAQVKKTSAETALPKEAPPELKTALKEYREGAGETSTKGFKPKDSRNDIQKS